MSNSYNFKKQRKLKKQFEVDVLEKDIRKYEEKINQLGQSETELTAAEKILKKLKIMVRSNYRLRKTSVDRGKKPFRLDEK